MKQITNWREKGKGFIDTILRFPLSIIFLIATLITNSIAINLDAEEPYLRILVSLLLGTSIYAVLQMLYERFFQRAVVRYLLMVITLILTLFYYFLIRKAEWNVEVTVRTTVILFILLVAFLWVPVIKSYINFNESFMAAFKAFFLAFFFEGILFVGTALIISVTDLLIFNVNEKAYLHSANIIFILLAPIHLLSMIPYYPNKDNLSNQEKELDGEITDEDILQQKRDDALIRLITPAKFLEALVSYVIIPITAIFTIILILYIIMNITGDFWTDNLMEPMLVSYSIVVIIVYLLASTVDNAFAKYFRFIFPKVLVPVVLFQTISSILRIRDVGVTYGRYYVIMFGVFATAAGIIFCFRPKQKNGLIAPILIALSLFSILPFIDVFTLSRFTQIERLEKVLEKNDMFDGTQITPNANISDEDKQTIISSVRYLMNMNYTEDIVWLKELSDNNGYYFKEIFGFDEYDQPDKLNRYVSILRDQSTPIPVQGYDYIVHNNVYNNYTHNMIISYQKEGVTYSLNMDISNQQVLILEGDGSELIRFDMSTIYDEFINAYDITSATTEEVTFTEQNESAILTVVAESINIYENEDGRDEQAEIYILLKLK